jgi:hypothetical protein
MATFPVYSNPGAVCFIDKVWVNKIHAEICENWGKKECNIISIMLSISGAANFPTKLFLY